MKAKFLWRRIPSSLKISSVHNQSELHNVWSLSQLLIERKYAQVFALLKQLHAYQWSSEEIRKLVEELTTLTKMRLIELINLAYMSINVQELANMFGLTTIEEAIKFGLEQKWTLDETKIYLFPLKKGE